MQSLKPIGVRPSYPSPGPRYFELACWSAVMASVGPLVGGRSPEKVAQSVGGDAGQVAGLILRSAVSGATTTASGWAAELASRGVSDFLTHLSPASAMAEVIRRGAVIPLDDYASISLPYRAPVAVGSWVAEAKPIAAGALTLSSTILSPHKAGILVVFSRELAQTSAAETVFTTMLRAAAGATIDTLYLSTTAGSADNAEGLLHGLSGLTSTGSALGDLGLLAKTCQGTDGSGTTVFVTTPALAAELSLRNDIRPGTIILGSVAVPAGRIIGIDPAGIAHTVNPVPVIDASEEAVLHMSDTPVDIGTAGPTVAAPSQSMFQTSQIVLRTLIDLGWVKWRADSVQYIDSVTW
jgi:hypothetical protein